MTPIKCLSTLALLRSTLTQYHPLIIEGMGQNDTRDPKTVSQKITSNVRQHWSKTRNVNDETPVIVVIQGDPIAPHGISAITRLVAEELGASRALVYLDEDIDPDHSLNADRENVVYEMRYSQLMSVLGEDVMMRMTRAIDARMNKKNERRKELVMEPLKSYYRDFALLQEVTKAAFKSLCDGITVAHTYDDISEFSVTSFYDVGLEIGMVDEYDIVSFKAE
mmetsp:Transcript_38260/g.46695  ORF Transcript_38260/g.46695 Transcript_38260/m.46695 type:complete len:222 (+) Transcript_38260:111-776(+)